MLHMLISKPLEKLQKNYPNKGKVENFDIKKQEKW